MRMDSRPVVVSHAHPARHLCFRKPTPGPELDLLAEFLSSHALLPDSGQRVAVFLEPKVETGYPDAVVAYWTPEPRLRGLQADALRRSDDQILQFIWAETEATEPALVRSMGRSVSKRLRELAEFGLVAREDDRLRVSEHALVLDRLVAIEAKVSAPGAALQQAVRNEWFASESYVLLPAAPGSRLMDRFHACGVGVLTPSSTLSAPTVAAALGSLPKSTLTWRFNWLAHQLDESAVA
jgi:hypothetical protein